MKPVRYLAYIILIILTLSCNTLYNSRSVSLEIVEPGNVIFPEWVNSIAIRYNNSNVSYNPSYEAYTINSRLITDENNTDSIASEIYFNSFLQNLKNTFLFDKIFEVESGNYSNVRFKSSERYKPDSLNNSLANQAIELFSKLLSYGTQQEQNSENIVIIDSEYGLYSNKDLNEIRDSTGADLLLSLDYFAMSEELRITDAIPLFINEYIDTWWNFYNLRENNLQYFYNRTDSISWTNHYLIGESELPNRKISIKNAAEMSGQRFAEFLTPHWIEVSRTLYRSGQVEMKKAEQLSKENKWFEAAKIWKVNTKNPNKNIAAKSMYNLALACEIEGNLDAAIDWVVKSYKVFEQKNQVHEFNCNEYFQILAQRKMDLMKINVQLNRQEAGL